MTKQTKPAELTALTIKPIAYIESDFQSKFGIPRQSGLTGSLRSAVVFTDEFYSADALRGLADYSHLWLIWCFSQHIDKGWSPTVRPPRLGGNKRIGVFATRSPFRPNPLGLSAVKIEEISAGEDHRLRIIISGADLLDGTPIFDIKPYISMDCLPDAVCGFQEETRTHAVEVRFPDDLLAQIPTEKRDGLLTVLSQDPRPSYHDDPLRVYGVQFAGFDIGFRVEAGVLRVVRVEKL